MEQLEMYIGPNNKEYYRSVFFILKGHKKTVFNFSAFFCTYFWLLYRKMYGEAIIIFLIELAIGLMLKGSGSILCSIVLGCIGNKLYMKKLERLKRKAKDYKAGGTNALIVILALIGTFAFPALLIKAL